MQPFTHPDLIREIHDAKIREALQPRRDTDGGLSRGVVHGIRSSVGGILVGIGTRLAPTEAPAPVIEFPVVPAAEETGPSDVTEGELAPENRQAA